MLKLGKMTDYGTVVMSALAAQPQAVHSASEIAAKTRLGAPTVRKLLKLLANHGLVDASRGAHGGYRLHAAPERISVADIVDALEGPVVLTECAGEHSRCVIESGCSLRGHWQPINAVVRRALATVSLAQIARPWIAANPGQSAGANPAPASEVVVQVPPRRAARPRLMEQE